MFARLQLARVSEQTHHYWVDLLQVYRTQPYLYWVTTFETHDWLRWNIRIKRMGKWLYFNTFTGGL